MTTTIAWIMLVAGILPVVAAAAAKAGGKAYNNDDPRPWLSNLEGWRARANAAQQNLFEGLPFFYAAVLFALFAQADRNWLVSLMLVWIVLRLAYIGIYIAGYGTLRSLAWGAALAVNILILFSAV